MNDKPTTSGPYIETTGEGPRQAQRNKPMTLLQELKEVMYPSTVGREHIESIVRAFADKLEGEEMQGKMVNTLHGYMPTASNLYKQEVAKAALAVVREMIE